MTIDLGTLQIHNQKLETIIKTRNIEEIKVLIVKFLENELVLKNEPNIKIKKGKWAKVANEIKGTMSESTSKYLQECSKEIRSGFELRNLPAS